MSQRKEIRSKLMIKKKAIFHKRDTSEDNGELSQNLIKNARKSGQLRLSGRGLTSVPEKIFTILDYDEHEVDYRFDMERPNNEDAWWSQTTLKVLDLSCNTLTTIPAKIQNLLDLTALMLYDNALVTLPNEIGFLKKLTKLNLKHNKLSSLPDGLFQLPDLRELNLSYNCLEEISPALTDLVMLDYLDLSHNKINILPPGLGYLTRTTNLNLAHNLLKELPPDVVNMRVLVKLEVTHNKIKLLPPSMGELRKIEFLYAQHNDIEAIPDFTGCDALKELYFGNNFIKEIPLEFCDAVPHIKILELRDNKIDVIPDEISYLQHLSRLDLTNNNITNIPTSITTLAHMQSLQLDGNPIRSIRRDIIQGGTTRILKALKDRIQDNNIEIKTDHLLPSQRGGMPDRHTMNTNRSLAVPGLELTEIPNNVIDEAKEANVTIVDISKNKFKEVPERLMELSHSLGELNLSSNLLTTIPSSLGTCSHIKYLELSQNMLTDLPPEIGELNYLRELVLNNNRFQKIPDCVYKLPSLEILLLRDNKISELIMFDPENGGLSDLKRLTVLDLGNNNIGVVPPELGNMLQIRTLELNGNAFRNPRHAILAKGTDCIMSYLRDRIPK